MNLVHYKLGQKVHIDTLPYIVTAKGRNMLILHPADGLFQHALASDEMDINKSNEEKKGGQGYDGG